VPKSPWKSFAAPKSDREYRAMLSYLPLNKWRAMPRFLRYSSQIQHQLADSEGLIGYSLDANILSRKFWTLSVWVCSTDASQQGDGGFAPGHGPDEILCV
jgi:hypothetical protein